MDDKTQNTYSNIVTIDPYTDSYFKSTSGFLTKENNPEYNKDNFYISYLSTKNFITAKINISKNILDEDLEDAITSKIYDELALDQATVYEIRYIEIVDEKDEKNRYFHLYIIDPLMLDDLYKNVIDRVKYIDQIIPSPLLFKSLYSKDIIKSSGVDCFVYFQENDAYITIYNNKEFIYTKSINYSMIEIYERFCELYGEKISYDKFITFLITENLKESKSDYKQYIIKLYKEILSNINEVLTYVKRAYDIEEIEHLYIDTYIDTQIKFDEIAEFELDISSSGFDFDYGFETNGEYVDHIHYLMNIYTSLDSDQKYEVNFTVFPRPPIFIKRDSGKFIIFTLIAFLLSFSYPIGYMLASYSKLLEFKLLENEYEEIHNKKSARDNIIRKKEKEKLGIESLVKAEEDNYNSKRDTLTKIHEIKVDYPMKAKIITILVKDLRKYNVMMEGLSYFENDKNRIFTMSLVSKTNRNITDFIKYLTKTYSGKYNFSTNDIVYDLNSNRYFCKLKVKVL